MSQTEKVLEIEIEVVDAKGKKVSAVSAKPEIFAERGARGLLNQVVRWQRAKRRAGTHKVKTRDEVSGGGIKPWKQKGLGKARAGSNTSPLWVRGGAAHGPQPRSYEFSLNKTERKKALCAALSCGVKEGKLSIVSDFGLKNTKTKDAAAVLSALGVKRGEQTLIVVEKGSVAEEKSFRNIENVKIIAPEGVNVMDIIWARKLFFSTQAFEKIEQRLS